MTRAADTTAPGIIWVDAFEAPFGLPPGREEAYRRRFATLHVDAATPARRTASGDVLRAVNATGEPVALKTLKEPAHLPGRPAGEAEDASRKAREAFRGEYEALVRLPAIKCFPAPYGFGLVDGEPAILMEWAEGTVLQELPAFGFAPGTRDGFKPCDVAVIGIGLFRLLQAMDELGEGIGLCELSPAEIVICTERAGIDEQMLARSLDLRFTGAGATGPASAARPACVQAACSILLEMLTGQAPPASDARPPAATRSEYVALKAILERSLAADQDKQPDAAALHRALMRWMLAHDRLRLPTDGSEPYPFAVDPRIFAPRAPGEEKLPATWGNCMFETYLDVGEDEANRRQDVSRATLGDRLTCWAARHAWPAAPIALTAYALALFLLGWLSA